MWSNVISIDKRYEREISYILDSVESTKDMSYATEESSQRIYVYVASACETRDEAEERVRRIAETVILDFFKQRFFCERLGLERPDLAQCALISSIVHFDREFESAVCAKAFSALLDYNIDGAYHFRLSALSESWEELAGVASRLLDGISGEGELYDIAAFITGSDGGKNQLLVERGRLKNLTCRKNVEVVNLYDRQELNLLSAILGERPLEIHISKGELSGQLRSSLKHIARVIER